MQLLELDLLQSGQMDVVRIEGHIVPLPAGLAGAQITALVRCVELSIDRDLAKVGVEKR